MSEAVDVLMLGYISVHILSPGLHGLLFLFLSGNETKLGMSRGIPEPKLTAMDAMIDKLTGAIFVFQIVVVMVLGVAGNVWKDTEARKASLYFV